MASVERTTIVVQKYVDFQEERYVLSLSKDEAQFLLEVMENIGGYSRLSRRKYADQIQEVLAGADVQVIDENDIDPRQSVIWFNNREEANL